MFTILVAKFNKASSFNSVRKNIEQTEKEFQRLGLWSMISLEDHFGIKRKEMKGKSAHKIISLHVFILIFSWILNLCAV